MYRLATTTDIPGVKALWREAFEEEPVLPDCPCYVAELDGKIVGMLFAIPQIFRADRDHKAAYLYAIATLKAYRGRGICRELMAYAEAHVAADCCVLVPAGESLFDFYRALGYETAFYRKFTVSGGNREISMEEYLQLREQILEGTPHMVWDDLTYAQTIYGLRFYKTEEGITAWSPERRTVENLPEDLGGVPYGMIKWLGEEEDFRWGYLGFALD